MTKPSPSKHAADHAGKIGGPERAPHLTHTNFVRVTPHRPTPMRKGAAPRRPTLLWLPLPGLALAPALALALPLAAYSSIASTTTPSPSKLRCRDNPVASGSGSSYAHATSPGLSRSDQ